MESPCMERADNMVKRSETGKETADVKLEHIPFIQELLANGKRLHFSLIDPDSQTPDRAGEIAGLCQVYGTDAIMVGGSTVKTREQVRDTIAAIKARSHLPTILFPNSAEAISENADYIFFMELMNSKEHKYRGGEQAKGAPLVKKWGIRPISMGYVVVSTSREPTTVERKVDLDVINEGDLDKALHYAGKAQGMGKSCVYFEAGSGAEKPVPDEMVRAVRTAIDIPLIIGGGIRDADTARDKIEAGADVIVTGTILERDGDSLEDIIKEIKSV